MGNAVKENTSSVPAKDENESEVYALLRRLRKDDSDSQAFSALCRIYEPLIDSMTRRFAPSLGITDTAIGSSGLGIEELRQDASFALYRAALRYDFEQKGKAVSFGLFAKICIRNAMISVLRRTEREKRRWERQRKNFSGDTVATGDVISEVTASRFRSLLSPFEYTVFALYITGKPPREISVDLGKSEKSVSNAIYRSKMKIKGMLAKKSDIYE